MFRRRRQDPAPVPSGTDDAVTDFWTWWSGGGADQIAAAFDSGKTDGVVEEMTPRIKAIDDALAWEFGKGSTSRHQLIVSTEGDPVPRAAARRWLRAAPPGDDTWSFHDLRQPGPLDAVLTIEGPDGEAELDFADTRVHAGPSTSGLDVSVFHPAFAALPDEARGQAAFLMLDAALGEEVVELWLDHISVVTEQPEGTQDLPGLVASVGELVRERMPDGEMSWSVLQGEGPDGPVIATTRSRLSSVQAPHLDEAVRVSVPYTDLTEEGWPAQGALDALRDFEGHLLDRVGDSGALVATESCGGVRTLHVYVDSTTPAADQVRAAVDGWPQGTVTVESVPDPGWEGVQHLRT